MAGCTSQLRTSLRRHLAAVALLASASPARLTTQGSAWIPNNLETDFGADVIHLRFQPRVGAVVPGVRIVLDGSL